MRRSIALVLAVSLAGVAQSASAGGYAFTTINHPLGADSTVASGVNSSGAITGSYYDGSNYHGFLDVGGTFTAIDHPLGAHGTFASGINNAGDITGYYTDADFVGHGFVYSGGAFTTIDHPLAGDWIFSSGTYASGINNAGAVTGTYYDANGPHGFVDDGGVFSTIDNPSALSGPFIFVGTFASGINDAGTVTGYDYDAVTYGAADGYVDAGGVFTAVNAPHAFQYTNAAAINNFGVIAGSYLDVHGASHGFVDTAGTFKRVNDPSANPSGFGTYILGINDLGVISGDYWDQTGFHGFIANPIAAPEPAVWAMMLIGMWGVGGATRRMRRRAAASARIG